MDRLGAPIEGQMYAAANHAATAARADFEKRERKLTFDEGAEAMEEGTKLTWRDML